LVGQLGALQGSIRLAEGGLTVSRSARGFRHEAYAPSSPKGIEEGSVDHAAHAADWLEDPAPRAAPETPATADYPLRYAGRDVGSLAIKWRTRADHRQAAGAWMKDFAAQCAAIVQRYDTQAWTARRLGQPMLLVGLSEPVRALERFLERAAGSELPVLLTGEFGAEMPLLAATIHCQGPRRDAPFVEVNCAEPAGSPDSWFARAHGGTLFLSGVDDLSPRQQSRLPLHMRSRLGQWLTRPDMADVRIIASTTRDLAALTEAGLFSRRLLSELDVLTTRAPSLRDRAVDIEPLIRAALEQRGYPPDDKISPQLVAACRSYDWPGNRVELERVVARLAVMTDARRIELDDIARHADWILRLRAAPVETSCEEAAAEPFTPSPPTASPMASTVPAVRNPTSIDTPDDWVARALRLDRSALSDVHEALRKSLMLMGERYGDPLSLEDLTRKVHVSPSHLSFLFRTELRISFKQLLLRMRIHRAREILAAEPRRQITDVAFSVGFADLSHFEKSFRKIVGRSPREFRRQTAGQAAGLLSESLAQLA
jgi:AraC-like DNA-binding protein